MKKTLEKFGKRRPIPLINLDKLAKAYEPQNVEGRIYQKWLDDGTFAPKISEGKPSYVIVIPPPNITGSLHMGHALDNTIQDLLIRFKRMQGFMALWIPGCDHAGIATQRVVEKELIKEGKSRWDLGREQFEKRIWDWKEKYGNTIVGQLKKLGCSCDWNRERFTMDREYSKAVREAFVRLYDEGLIYKGHRIINWCPACLTALSDLELEHKELPGHLYYLHYPLSGQEEGQGVVIATTRPETILADTAVAVNPDDPRYRKLIGKNVILPLVGRELPVIADPYVDMEFGTGALKITPAHDPNDFNIGEKHNLKTIVVLDEKARMNENAGQYQGLSREEARKKIIADLKAAGYLVKVEDHLHAVGHCYRCGTQIEPYLSWQWFMKMEALASPAVSVVKEGAVKFIPERFNRVYLNWMENLKDWCISRQLWWGHRIPVWTCRECKSSGAFREEPQTCPGCGKTGTLEQEEDVLDTWFSSALWPFATLGWPQETQDLKLFYPTSVLVTARDIIFLWVSRMIMSGLKFMGQPPFSDVCIHSTILTATGQRMSKSLGTGVDPLALFDKYGTDATRFGLIAQTEQGQDIKYSEEKLANARNFMNKIWNAFRFCSAFLENFQSIEPVDFSRFELKAQDRWILSLINRTVEEVTEDYQNYNFWQAGRALYHFFWDNFCDWYLEIVKPALYEGGASLEKHQTILYYVLERFFKLAHPLIPFITEELWSFLPGKQGVDLITASWPQAETALYNPEAETEMEFRMQLIKTVRNLRSEISLPPQKQVEIFYETNSEKELAAVNSGQEMIRKLAGIETLERVTDTEAKLKFALSGMVDGLRVYLPLDDLPELQKEIERLEKSLEEAIKEMGDSSKRLQNPQFFEKAKPEIIAREKERYEGLKEKENKIRERLKLFCAR